MWQFPLISMLTRRHSTLLPNHCPVSWHYSRGEFIKRDLKADNAVDQSEILMPWPNSSLGVCSASLKSPIVSTGHSIFASSLKILLVLLHAVRQLPHLNEPFSNSGLSSKFWMRYNTKCGFNFSLQTFHAAVIIRDTTQETGNKKAVDTDVKQLW